MKLLQLSFEVVVVLVVTVLANGQRTSSADFSAFLADADAAQIELQNGKAERYTLPSS